MPDFRSDTVTLPCAAMRTAIAAARRGDAARGDDPTVAEFERVTCGLTVKGEAPFVPSGTMANLAALIAHECRGGEVRAGRAARMLGGGMRQAGLIAGPAWWPCRIPLPVTGATMP